MILTNRNDAMTTSAATPAPSGTRTAGTRTAGARTALALATLLMSLVTWTGSARAADTIETWALGFSDVDFYAGYDGLGRSRADSNAYTNMMLGVGILNELSANLGIRLQGDGNLEGGESGIFLGLLGTPLDTDHVDLDLMLDVSASGPGLSNFNVAPSMELNLDWDPSLATWGFYLRVGMPVYGRQTLADPTATHGSAFSIVLNPGIYWTVAKGHQLLVEFDMAFHRKSADDHKMDIGGVALGYNVVLHKRLELISQVTLDIPQSGQKLAAGLMVGFIATMPTGQTQ